jgi:hypothetical protein
MKSPRFVCLFVLLGITTVLAQNPVPLENRPLVPTAIAPGGASFKLTVDATGFVSASTVNWNSTVLTTSVWDEPSTEVFSTPTGVRAHV